MTGPKADREGAISQTEEERARDRVALFQNLDMVAHSAAWIRANVVRRKTISLRRSSYGLKHDVERAAGVYITNGSFIAAAVGLGYRFRANGPNAYFNFSRTRSAKQP